MAKFFPAWTVTREQWADMLMPSISGVAIDTLLLIHRFASMSPLPAHQFDRKPRGFPGHVPTSSACLPRRIRLRGGMSARSGTSLPCSATYRQSGECATSIYSQTPDCFSVMTTAPPERSYQFRPYGRLTIQVVAFRRRCLPNRQ